MEKTRKRLLCPLSTGFELYYITDARNCDLTSQKAAECQRQQTQSGRRAQVPGQGKEQACPLLSTLGSVSKVWGDLHLELEELDRHTQKTKSPAMATFIQHRKLMGEIAGQRVNFDVALVTTSQNTSFCKWCWEDNTGWDQKRALKDQARANDVHSLETILFQHNILKYVSTQSLSLR